jgi:hypothetical protein
MLRRNPRVLAHEAGELAHIFDRFQREAFDPDIRSGRHDGPSET